MKTVRCVVTNQVFLLGLDELYRQAMKPHERKELLRCARSVTATLGVVPELVPVEGYYAEDEQLTEYFLLMRALQKVGHERKPEVAGFPEYERLCEVTGSGLYGEPEEEGMLLPGGADPLDLALASTYPDWTIPTLTAAAYDAVNASGGFSLVGLACLAKDALAITAMRESTVLYAAPAAGAVPEPVRRTFVWAVESVIAERAQRFIDAFNNLFGEALPPATMASAEAYWDARADAHLISRCVCIGRDGKVPPRHYHWAIDVDEHFEPVVKDFWSDELWTTERYRDHMRDATE